MNWIDFSVDVGTFDDDVIISGSPNLRSGKIFWQTNRQTDKQTNRQTDKLTNKQTEKQTNRQKDNESNRQTMKQQADSLANRHFCKLTVWPIDVIVIVL